MQAVLKDSNSKAFTYFNLAGAYKLKQDYVNALANYNKAETIYKDLKSHDSLVKTYVTIAEFFRFKYDFVSADKYLNIAKEAIDRYDVSDKNIAYYLNRKAAIYIEKDGDFSKSIECSMQVLEIARRIGDQSLEASSLNEIGYAYENLNNPIAETYYAKSLKLFYTLGDLLSQANILNNLVRLYDKQGRIKDAKKYVDEGYRVATKSGYERDIMVFSNLYALYYEEIGEYKKALEYHEKFRLLEKKDLIGKWDNRVIEAERKYELEKKDKELEIKNLSLLSQSKDLENSKNRLFWALIALISLILFVSITIYFLRKSKKDNKKLKSLSEQNKFLLSEANHRINNNLQLVILLIDEQIKKLSKKESEEIKKILTKVNAIATLHKHLYQSEDKRNINSFKYFNDIKTNFLDLFKENDITAKFYVQSMDLPTDSVMYLGLLLTELCINSLKHAFKDQEFKEINFHFKNENGVTVFNYSDNGKQAIKKDIKPKLIDKLCRQLKLQYQIETEEGFSFKFKKAFI